MSRTRISRDLGPLPSFKGLKSAQDKTGSLLQVLRSLALKNQREQPRVFYSLREVAKKFKVPVSTVAKAYRDLEQEGFLSRMRSSKTVLNGLQRTRKLSVRGFVGLPVLTSNFITIQDYRTLLNCLRSELWLRGFAATMFFFKPEELANGKLVEQLKSYEVDTVIWLHPGRTATETLLRLGDFGIRNIVISEVGTPGVSSRYFIWKERAIETLLRDWKHRNLANGVMLINSMVYRSPVIEEVVRVVLQSLGIEPVSRNFEGDDASAFIRTLHRSEQAGVIFPALGLLSMFAFRSPGQLIELINSHHVAFADGPTDFPFAQMTKGEVDLVTVDLQTLAESIVNDLITGEAYDRNQQTTFEAEARLRVPLRSICEEMRPSRSAGAL